MGGKYEIIGMYYPCGQSFDYHEFTDSKSKAKKLFKMVKKKYFYSSIIIRNDKKIKENIKAEDNYNVYE